MRKLLLFAFVALGVAAACGGGSTTLDPQKYDRACQTAADCVVVVTQACCGCPSAAINASAKAQYDADFAAAEKNCGDIECPGVACEASAAGCSAGVCVLTQPPPVDAGSD